jgi:hypothetical protein
VRSPGERSLADSVGADSFAFDVACAEKNLS